MGQTVDVGYGKANLSNTLVTYAAMKVQPPFLRTSAATSGRRVTANTVHSVGVHDHTGALIRSRVEHDNGTIILLQVSWKRGGAPISDGALFMRLRAGAPQYDILGKLPLGQENRHGDRFSMFTGYADIMNEDDLIESNLQVNRMFIDKFMSHEELSECFHIVLMQAETAPRPTSSEIFTGEGESVMRQVAVAPKRRMRF